MTVDRDAWDLISIPQRCDWKGTGRVRVLPGAHLFQYLKGAIGSLRRTRLDMSLPAFQYLKGAIGSTLVPEPPLRSKRISIPQRCDWKPREMKGLKNILEFQYLKGAIGRWVPPPLEPRYPLISIPQRCDWKLRTRCASTTPRRISIPQRCDWKSNTDSFNTENFNNFNTSKVRLEASPNSPCTAPFSISIPQRCDWKRTGGTALEGTRRYFNTSKVRLEDPVVAASKRR